MSTKLITIDGVQVYVEVDETDLPPGLAFPAAGDDDLEPTGAAERISEVGGQLRAAIKAVTQPLREVLQEVQPDEWSLEFNVGFKGGAGIPCITQGELNGSVKVTAKWKKS